jgi:peptidoglycan/xylan/chitin deacetylase (PgdA/CDA1 family)
MKLVQCWDDAVVDDIRLCDILRRRGAKASFNINPALHGPQRAAPWRYRKIKDVHRLALDELRPTYAGFTVANHSMSHPHPTQIPLDAWRREVVDARKWLQDWFGQPVLGFAYPFGECDDATAAVVRDAGHVYARATGNCTPCFPPADAMRFQSDTHALAPHFWDRLAAAKAAAAPVFYFWGHSYELISEDDWQAFDAKIARLSADPELEWADLPDLFARG